MNLRADEISSIIKQQIRDYDKKTECSESGTVIVVGDGIARAQGLEKCMANELLEFEGGGYGMALNLEEYTVSIVLLDNSADIREGTVVKRTGKVVSVPVGEGLLGGECFGCAHRRKGTGSVYRIPSGGASGSRNHQEKERFGSLADRDQGDRQHDPHRQRTKRADHWRPSDR